MPEVALEQAFELPDRNPGDAREVRPRLRSLDAALHAAQQPSFELQAFLRVVPAANAHHIGLVDQKYLVDLAAAEHADFPRAQAFFLKN